MITLHHADARVFAALVAGDSLAGFPPVCPGGIDTPGTLRIVAGMAARMREAFLGQSAWAIVTSTEAVGLISFISAPSESIVEIGFGVGERRRGRGYASAAVRAVAALARDAGLSCLTAETASDNHASQRVLERNGFVRGAEREDPVDGHLIGWSLDLKGME